jgi:hypothetical protein
MKKLDLALDSAKRLINLPYRWGGNDPMEGFDCSGLVIEILQSAGLFPRNKDTTAHGLSLLFPETEVIGPGVLVFYDWNSDKRFDHVEMVIAIDEDGELYTIGASDGDDRTTTVTNAQMQDAYVKIRPLRGGYTKAVNPFEAV